MLAYAVLGGMPSYLEQFDSDATLGDNVCATILGGHTYLSEEPDWLLLRDLRRDAVYGSILRAVAGGNRKPSDIARAIGRASAQDVGSHLATLQDLSLIMREVPITEKGNPRSRSSLYFIADNYLDFWFRYVDPTRGAVSRGLGDELWRTAIEPELHRYASRPAFERACRDYLWRAAMAGALPEGLRFADVGSWWGMGDREIDVVAADERGMVTLAGSCKWTGEPVDVADYAALQRDAAAAGFPTETAWLALFSRSGFTERLKAIAEAQQPGRVWLVDLGMMYGG
jgi:hypothetical protein